MKKYFFLFACFFSVFAVFAEPQFEFGVGSGYVFYGDKDLKNLLSDFDQKNDVMTERLRTIRIERPDLEEALEIVADQEPADGKKSGNAGHGQKVADRVVVA